MYFPPARSFVQDLQTNSNSILSYVHPIQHISENVSDSLASHKICCSRRVAEYQNSWFTFCQVGARRKIPERQLGAICYTTPFLTFCCQMWSDKRRVGIERGHTWCSLWTADSVFQLKIKLFRWRLFIVSRRHALWRMSQANISLFYLHILHKCSRNVPEDNLAGRTAPYHNIFILSPNFPLASWPYVFKSRINLY